MDKIFTQEELFWLDDILPGTKIGRIRRLSAGRHVHMPKPVDDEPPTTVNKFASNFSFSLFSLITKKKQNNHFQPPIDRLNNDRCRNISGNNLRSIAEVGWYIELHEMNSNI